MSKFDEIFDEFVYMAKNAADVATKKTGEVVEVSKLRYQIKQTQWEIEKTYAKLGAIVYESKKGTENFDEMIQLAVVEIDDLNQKLADLAQKVRAYKKIVECTSCSKENEMGALYCTRCGAPLFSENAAAGDVIYEDFTAPEEDD